MRHATVLLVLLAACDSGSVSIDDTDTITDTTDDTDTVTAPAFVDETCDGNVEGVFDPYPEVASVYPIGSAATYPWPGEDFEGYTDGQLIESSDDLGHSDHLDVTKGQLDARYAGEFHRGFADDDLFIALARGLDGQLRVGWSDVAVSGLGSVAAWKPAVEDWSGLNLIVRYQSSDDFYFASLRYDGEVSIKRKHCGTVDVLAQDTFGTMNTSQWYDLRFVAEGTTLTFEVDDQEVLTVDDDTLSWGSAGWYTSHAEAWLDAWSIAAP
ncbi:MAG: hypothetical protein H6733_09080 [Alphaproteobacteria bacterium]|nr:hypothetical protein [Alphaproteobacteria bacterium]